MEGLHCSDCEEAFATRHAYSVHMKGSKHQRVLAALAQRTAWREKDENMERQKLAFSERWREGVQVLWERYQEESHATLGSLLPHSNPWHPGCSLSQSMMNFYLASRPRPHIIARRKALYRFIFKICKLAFQERASCEVYGSIPHRIDQETSDIDMSIRVSGVPDDELLDLIGLLVELCAGPEQMSIKRVLHARVPVISFVDPLTLVQLDLSIWNIDKLHISSIFSLQLDLDPRIRPLVFSVRSLAKSNSLTDAYSGYINSFGWTVAVMCYLLTLHIIPVVTEKDTLANVQATWQSRDAENPTSVGDLFLGFLQWFLDWDFKNTRLSMRQGGVCAKEADRFEDYCYILIERPQTPWQNIVRQVEPPQWKHIRSHLQKALARLKEDGATLRDIL